MQLEEHAHAVVAHGAAAADHRDALVQHADVADEFAEVRAKVKEVCWREFHEVRRRPCIPHDRSSFSLLPSQDVELTMSDELSSALLLQ